MKKSLGLLALSVILLTSCRTTVKTARTAEFPSSLQSVTVADLKVTDERITHTMSPDRKTRRGGLDNIQKTAEREALEQYGDADVLLDPQYVVSKRKGLFGSKVTSITVSGRPACFTNHRVLHDSVWSNPTFRRYYGNHGNRAEGSVSLSGNRKVNRETFSVGYFRKKGFTKHIALTGMRSKLELSDGGGVAGDVSFAANALLSLGYQFNPHFYLGAGSGVMYLEEVRLGFIPVFGNVRGYLSKSRKSFFCDLKLGHFLTTVGNPRGETEWEGKMYRSLAVGYSFGKLDVAIEAAKRNFQFWDYDGGDYWDLKLSSIGLSLGFRF